MSFKVTLLQHHGKEVPVGERDGVLEMLSGGTLSWKSGGATSSLALRVTLGEALQKQTMKASAKMRLVTAQGASVFQFASSEDMGAVVECLREDYAPPVESNLQHALSHGTAAMHKGAALGRALGGGRAPPSPPFDPLRGTDIPELKKRAFRVNPKLKENYTTMVVTGRMLTEEQFWMERDHKQALVEAKSALAPIGLSNNLADLENCMVTLPSDVPGGPERKILKITREARVHIFAGEPWVKEAYDAFFERRMGNDTVAQLENTFWNKLYKARERRKAKLMTVRLEGRVGERMLLEDRDKASRLTIKSLTLDRFMELYSTGCFGELKGFAWTEGGPTSSSSASSSSSSASSSSSSSSAAAPSHTLKSIVPIDSDLASSAADLQLGGRLRFRGEGASVYEDSEVLSGILDREGRRSKVEADRVAGVVQSISSKEFQNVSLFMERNAHSRSVLRDMEKGGGGGGGGGGQREGWGGYGGGGEPPLGDDLTAPSSDPNAGYLTLKVDIRGLAGVVRAAASGSSSSSSSSSAGGGGGGGMEEEEVEMEEEGGSGRKERERMEEEAEEGEGGVGEGGGWGSVDGPPSPKATGGALTSGGRGGDVAAAAAAPPHSPTQSLSQQAAQRRKYSQFVLYDIMRQSNDLWEAQDRNAHGFSRRIPIAWSSWVRKHCELSNQVMKHVWEAAGVTAMVGEKRGGGGGGCVTQGSYKWETFTHAHRNLKKLHEVAKGEHERLKNGGALGQPPSVGGGGRQGGGKEDEDSGVVVVLDQGEDAKVEVIKLLDMLSRNMAPSLRFLETSLQL